MFEPVLSTDNISDVREQPEAAVSPDGQYILAGGADDTIHVWSTISGQEARHQYQPDHLRRAPQAATARCPAGRCAADACTPKLARQLTGCLHALLLLCVAHVLQVTRWRGHAGAPLALKWAPTRCLVASGCQAGGLALWIPPPPGTTGGG